MTLDNNIKAIVLIILGMFVFSIQDALIKLISDSINIYVIYIVRSIVGLLVIFVYCKFKKIKLVFKTHYPLNSILRVSGFFLGFSLYYFSLSKISLPEAVTLFFISPFFVTIFSKFIIGERVGIYRWCAIIIYFVMQNIIFSSHQVTEYKFVLMSWEIPSLYFLAILIIIGFTGVIGFFSLFGAYRIGSPSTIAPYEYSLIIWSILFGYFIWNDYLTITGFAGLSLILIASFFTLYREYKLSIQVNLDKPIR